MLAVNAPHAVTATAYDRTTQRFERMHSHPLNAKTARIFSYFMRFYQRCFSCFFLPWQLVSALLGRWVLVISPSVHKIKPNWTLPKILNLNGSNFKKPHCDSSTVQIPFVDCVSCICCQIRKSERKISAKNEFLYAYFCSGSIQTYNLHLKWTILAMKIATQKFWFEILCCINYAWIMHEMMHKMKPL